MYYGFGEEWDRMLEELDELCPEAAAEMREIHLSSVEFREKHDSRWSKLQDVLHAVEWWRSFDWGKDQVDEVIARYRSNLNGHA